MKLWTKVIRENFKTEKDKENYIETIKINCISADEYTKKLLSYFIEFLDEEKDTN